MNPALADVVKVVKKYTYVQPVELMCGPNPPVLHLYWAFVEYSGSWEDFDGVFLMEGLERVPSHGSCRWELGVGGLVHEHAVGSLSEER